MSIKDHPKFNEAGTYEINENHSMVFLHSDGFTERLLNIDIFITKSNKYEVYLRCFKKGNEYGGFKHEFESNNVPNIVVKFIDKINKIEELDFGYVDDNQVFMDDCQRQEILFNHKGKTIGFFINGGVTINSDDFKTEFGKSFLSVLYLSR